MVMDRETSKIAIIGAGPCGLSQLRAFCLAEAAGCKIPEIVCYEKQNDWGGQWNLTWRTGLDEFGEAVHSGMYRHLWTNAPKECYEFADYSYDKHFNKPMPSYLNREHNRDYILGRAKELNLHRYIRYNNAVRFVEFDQEKNQFIVRIEDLTSGKNHTDFYDYVIVATSHFSTPHIPHFQGTERFPGRIIHSHDFRDGREFAGLNLLVIGGSYSAEDIALQSYKFGAKSVTISYRTNPMGFKWPKEIEELPLLVRIGEDKIAHFQDGSQRQVDAIILATGYRHYFPFITDSLRLVTQNRLCPSHLYKGIFFQNQPRLIYLGMQDLYFTTTLFDAQTWYVRDVILKRICIPEIDEREKDLISWQERESKLENDIEKIDFQASYMEDLLAVTDYPKFNLKEACSILKQWEHDKMEDILSYRNHNFSSLMTGTMSISPTVPWIDANGAP